MEVKKFKGDSYAKLINYAFKNNDAVMFVYREDGLSKDEIEKMNEVREKNNIDLGDSLYFKRKGSYWVHTKVGHEMLGYTDIKDPEGYQNKFEVCFYKNDEKLKKYILSNEDLYLWLSPKYPEDISFFRDGYCWLYSVAHEEYCDIYCRNKDEYEYLKSIGIEFYENNYRKIFESELYFEDYKKETQN